MDDNSRFEPNERVTTDDTQLNGPDDPNSATNDSNVGTVAGTTGPTPLTGGQIVSATTDDMDPVT